MVAMTTRCASGHYCPVGTVNPTDYPCAAGTFTDANDTIQQSDCDICPAGVACLTGTGGYNGLQPVTCEQGFYCPLGTQYSTQFPCPAGTYGSNPGLMVVGDCTDCDPGRFCTGGLDRVGSSSDSDGLCLPGYYCPLGSSTSSQNPCEAGTYREAPGAASQAECSVCPKGSYCVSASVIPVVCPNGTFANDTGTASLDECNDCYAGMYCIEGMETIPTMLDNSCPTAHYCPSGTQMPLECPPGSFNPVTGRGDIVDCLPCTAGMYCSSASTQPTGT